MIGDFFRVTPKKRTVRLKSKKGVLFRNPGLGGKIIFYAGTWTVIGAFIYGLYLYLPLLTAVINYWQYQKSIAVTAPDQQTVLPTPTLSPQNPIVFEISIPEIGAKTTIVPNVSPFDPKEYLKVLENNVVAQAKGSDDVGLGSGHSTYIFAHSTQQGMGMVRKNAVFYLLGQLKQGDEFFINNYGKILVYRVYKQQIVNANQTEFIKYRDPEKEVVILQTCWPIGTDWKRLLVFAERVD